MTEIKLSGNTFLGFRDTILSVARALTDRKELYPSAFNLLISRCERDAERMFEIYSSQTIGFIGATDKYKNDRVVWCLEEILKILKGAA